MKHWLSLGFFINCLVVNKGFNFDFQFSEIKHFFQLLVSHEFFINCVETNTSFTLYYQISEIKHSFL